jgi:hypothetical protein
MVASAQDALRDGVEVVLQSVAVGGVDQAE